MDVSESKPTSKRVTRVDVGRLDKFERTPSGGLRIPAMLTRAGVFSYPVAGGGVIREYRPAEEVLAAASIASLDDAPVTDLHPDATKYPSELVDPQNWRDLAKGSTKKVRVDGTQVLADVVVLDAEEIRLVESGDRVEVSCGYTCEHEQTSGEFEGQPFDVVQRNIRYNHVALGPRGWGRAGPDAALRLDTSGRHLRPEETSMSTARKVRVDGIEYDAGTDSHIQAVEKLLERNATQLATVTKDLETQRGRADGLQERLTKADGDLLELKKKLDKAMSPAELDARVAQRVSLVDRARRVMGADYAGEGKTDRQVMDDVLGKAGTKLPDGSTDEYVKGRFEQATEKAAEGAGAGNGEGGAGGSTATPTTDSKDGSVRVAPAASGAPTPGPRTLEVVRQDNAKFEAEAPSRFAMKKGG